MVDMTGNVTDNVSEKSIYRRKNMRESGILLPVSALPAGYGIGGFSKKAYEFVDWLQEAGQKNWQILPLGPTSYGDSPYQSFSTFAGNPYYIDLDTLREQGLLTEEECREADCGQEPRYVDYGRIYETRFAVLRKAFARFRETEEFLKFEDENAYWLEDYCLYMAVKGSQGQRSWQEWPEELKTRDPEALDRARGELAEEIRFYRFQQYCFEVQWKKLKQYANVRGIRIIGDIPSYVALDSADAWANPELFQFDENSVPLAVAGCPPDAFAATGQLWGNPLYRWEKHEETGYAWWIRRIQSCFRLYDVIRIDHFRGFESYYSIPYGDKTAEKGHWEPGPGIGFFKAVQEKLGELDIIAEDLGYLTEGVREMLRESGYPGMKVLEFAFDSREESDYLPHNYPRNCVVYTGTHDNNTLAGWYQEMAPADREFSVRYMNNGKSAPEEIPWDFIRMALASVADLAVVPMQDYLGLGAEARFNYPSTIGTNWKWRLLPEECTKELAAKIRAMTKLYGRL